MAVIGLRYLKYSPITSDESTSSFPTHTAGSGFDISEISSLDFKINMAEGEQYGDDVLIESNSDFVDGDLTCEVCGMTLETEKKLFGLTQGSTDTENEYYDSIDDASGYGALGGIQVMQKKGVQKFRGYIFTKVKPIKPDETASTKQKNMSYGTQSLKFKAMAPMNGKWRIRKEFDTAAAAITWLQTYLKFPTTSG